MLDFLNTNPGKKGSLIHRSFFAPFLPLVYVCSKLQKRTEQFFIFAGQLLF
jgi:hypothetical protein